MALGKIFIIPCNIRSGSLVHNALHGNIWLLGRIDVPGSRWRRGSRTLVLNSDLCIHMHSFRSTRGFHRNGTPLAMPFSRCRLGVLGIFIGARVVPHARTGSMHFIRNRSTSSQLRRKASIYSRARSEQAGVVGTASRFLSRGNECAIKPTFTFIL